MLLKKDWPIYQVVLGNMKIIKRFLSFLYNYMEKCAIEDKEKEYRKKFNIHPTARLGYLPHIVFKGNITIGSNSYFNSGKISTGKISSVKIGKWCAIGYNVNIHAITHNADYSTGPEEQRPAKEADIIIGDNVWIGSNSFILPGVTIGNNSVVGANSVVTKSIPDNAIFGGIPAKLIRYKKGFEK